LEEIEYVVTKHIQMNEMVEIEKEKEELQRQLKILQDENKNLEKSIERLNKEKEASLLEIIHKLSIPDTEILPKGSKEEYITNLERQIGFLHKEFRRD
jgi:seryl-tRNA synthetase